MNAIEYIGFYSREYLHLVKIRELFYEIVRFFTLHDFHVYVGLFNLKRMRWI